MHSLKSIAEANINASARANGARLLNELRLTAQALPEDSPRRQSAEALIAEVEGDNLVKPSTMDSVEHEGTYYHRQTAPVGAHWTLPTGAVFQKISDSEHQLVREG
jgi:hypothetical protein